MDKIIGVLALVFMVTALAVVVSKRSQTANVLTALLNGIAKLQRAAVSPVTGK
jgi:preprotein translocase subunit SecG